MGGAEYGAPPYDPALVLRMLFISDLFDLSERQTEEFVNYHLPAKFFVGLCVDDSAPDHSTLSVFRKRMIEKDKEKAFRVLFEQVVKLAQRKGVKFGKVQVVDSVGRFFLMFARDGHVVAYGLQQAQVIALGSLVVAVLLVVYLRVL